MSKKPDQNNPALTVFSAHQVAFNTLFPHEPFINAKAPAERRQEKEKLMGERSAISKESL